MYGALPNVQELEKALVADYVTRSRCTTGKGSSDNQGKEQCGEKEHRNIIVVGDQNSVDVLVAEAEGLD